MFALLSRAIHYLCFGNGFQNSSFILLTAVRLLVLPLAHPHSLSLTLLKIYLYYLTSRTFSTWMWAAFFFTLGGRMHSVSLSRSGPSRSRYSGKVLLSFLLGLFLIGSDLYAQDYEATLNQRRRGDQIHVEVWVKATSATSPVLGDASLVVQYNQTYLTPSTTQLPASTDSVGYDVDVANPVVSIASQFNGANGYNSVTTASYGPGFYSLEIELSSLGSGGLRPDTAGRGSFLGVLIFDIQGSPSTSSNTSIEWSKAAVAPGNIEIFDVNGTSIRTNTTFTDPPALTIIGITVLNPNGPAEVVDRDKPYASINSTSANRGYPIYFERSGLDPNNSNIHGTTATAYVIEYSLNGGTSWTELGRVAETTVATSSIASIQAVVSGDIATTATTHVITTQDGLPLVITANRDPLRVVWSTNASFFGRSENARIRITQLTTPVLANITSRTKLTPFDISDNNFIIGRLFFAQLNGTDQYMRTAGSYSNATPLTVETWINLNEYKSVGSEPAIVASSGGPFAAGDEGAWMLYLKDGRYPAFRAREILGRGPSGYIATIVSPDSLAITTDVSPLGNSHASNWVHLAATVDKDTVILYVNGEIVDRKTNDSATDIRMSTTNHPIWIGVNPTTSGTISSENYLHAGLKGTRVWRSALTHQQIRQQAAGIASITNTSGTVNILKALELAYTLEGTLQDAASEQFFQNQAQTLNFYNSGTVDNAGATFRPDLAHIRLTSPVGNEGVSNLPDTVFTVRWIGYGLGTVASVASSDVRIEFSLDAGSTWSTAGSVESDLSAVNLEDGEASWIPATSATLRTLPSSAFSHSALLRITGASSNDAGVTYTSRSFTVAPFFALQKTLNNIITIDDGGSNRSLNVSGDEIFVESWIRPYRFPTVGEGFFPIISKVDTTTGDLYYSLRLLPTGQLQFVLRDTSGTLRTATSSDASGSTLVLPNSVELDSAWTHVGVYVNLGNGGTSNIRFYVDGTPQTDTAVTNQLGSGLAVSSTNEYPVFVGYEKSTTATYSFLGEMRELRYWNGAPNATDATGTEPTAMTSFIQGALGVHGDELGSSSNQNLVASLSFNGYAHINRGFHRSIRTSNSTILGRFYADSLSYVAAPPYIKIVEPTFRQRVRNSETDTRIRWVGYDYGTVTTGTAVPETPSLEYSIRGGGGIVIQPYQYVASAYWNATQANATILTTTASYLFAGTGTNVQFAAQLNVSAADPDPDDDGVYTTGTVPLAATLTNARLRITATPSSLITTTTTIQNAQGEGPLFTIVPPSNFTVRIVLEGYHDDFTTTSTLTDLQSTYAGGGLKIKLYRDNAGTPGELVDSSESEYQYADLDFANRNAGTSRFANVPFIFTSLQDGNYWVVVDHPNHLPVMSRYPAPFRFSGDNEDTWDIESGWDFQSWSGAYNNVLTTTGTLSSIPSTTWLTQGLFSAYSDNSAPVNVTEATTYPTPYANTGLIFNRGIAGNGAISTTTSISAMVGGDVNKDGQINAADRVLVVTDAGTALVRSDITGDGIVNATDREIVFRNVGKVSSIINVDFPAAANHGGGAPVPMVAPSAEPKNDILALFMPSMAGFGAVQNAEYNVVQTNGIVPTTGGSAPEALAVGAVQYTVIAEPKVVGNYLEMPVYIQNKGTAFGMGNATFAISYNTSALRFVSLDNIAGVPYNAVTAKGYSPMFSAPKPNSNQALPNVRSIEIEFDKRAGQKGELVPSTKQSLGMLRFELKRTDMPLIFKWYRSTVVHATEGDRITGQGEFRDIQSILLYTATVLSPNGGESWRTNKNYTVTWKNNNAPLVRLEYSTDNGVTWLPLTKEPVQSSLQSYVWRMPATLNSDKCLIRVLDDATGIELDRSDRTFSVKAAYAAITRPAVADPIYTSGKSETINWQSAGFDKVRFEFSADGGFTWQSISTERKASDGLLYWSIPSANTKHAVVRMIDLEDNSEAARSGEFRILAGTLSFTSPKTSDVLKGSESTRVRWNSNNLEMYDLQYTVDGGQNWTPVQSNVDAGKRTYDWTVPFVTTQQAMLRALYNNDPDLEYSRTPMFAIQGPTDVEEFGDGLSIGRPFPNPFNNNTAVSFTLPVSQRVSMSVHNYLGEEVSVVLNGSMMTEGLHTVTVSGENLASGVYYLHITVGNTKAVRRLVIMR